MSSELDPPTGPIPEEFAGASASATLKRLFHATRPKFYPASVLPVIVGTAWWSRNPAGYTRTPVGHTNNGVGFTKVKSGDPAPWN